MTIASAFNEITASLGGTPAKQSTITAAIDALNDTLAGSDQRSAETIEEAVRLLGQHISAGGSGGGSVPTLGNVACVAYVHPLPSANEYAASYGSYTFLTDTAACLGDEWDDDAIVAISGLAYADGCTVRGRVSDEVTSPTTSGPVSAVIGMGTSYDEQTEEYTCTVTAYTGATCDTSTGYFYVPLHDVPADVGYGYATILLDVEAGEGK